MKITKAEWEAKGLELFGKDKAAWVFVCPACGNEMSMTKARTDLAQHIETFRARRYAVELECVGRHVDGIGCDWAAYGLFAGPLFVDGVAAFDFAGKPFTAEATSVTP